MYKTCTEYHTTVNGTALFALHEECFSNKMSFNRLLYFFWSVSKLAYFFTEKATNIDKTIKQKKLQARCLQRYLWAFLKRFRTMVAIACISN